VEPGSHSLLFNFMGLTDFIYRILNDNGTRNFVNPILKVTVICQDLQITHFFHVQEPKVCGSIICDDQGVMIDINFT